MSEFEVLMEFKKQLISFFDELVDQFPNEGDLIVVRLFLTDQIPIQDAMNIFNHKMNSDNQMLKKMVHSRNEAFFIEHSLFDTLGKDKVNHFKKLWRSGNLDDDNKRIIWQWVDTFVFLGDKYMKAIQKNV